MPSNEDILHLAREALHGTKGIAEKNMFGGTAFMLNGNMLAGVTENDLMLRVGKDQYEEVLEMDHARKMDFTGKPMKGFVYVDMDGLTSVEETAKWIQLAKNFVEILPRK